MTKSPTTVFDFSARLQPIVEGGVFDTLLFSDKYRRNVFFTGPTLGIQDDLASLVRQLGVLSTYYYGEYKSTDADNKVVIAKCIRTIKDISWRAKELGADKVIIPFGGKGNIFAHALKVAMEQEEFSTDVQLRSGEYTQNLSVHGPVQKNKATILDEGLRGVCHFNQDLITKWDREIA